ncbi:restriction endonuclease subunit S [Candidatus Poriferisodalis sp.]|uniref:restriction endonuclease subunit S n=1 Tax=Candidatus Poriferisodalis sp. TaxID=3101277 RepID=UPI003B59A945
MGLGDQTPDGTANVFDADDVLFGKLRPYLAKAVRPGFGGICSTEFLVLRAVEFTPEFLRYVLLSDEFVSAVDSSTYGAKMPRANWEFIGNVRVLVPPRNEQVSITAYLDRETARVDELISKQELLIERLGEYRVALITRTVTRGLPPDAAEAAGLDPAPPLKDSGVEWLGKVPEHWDVVENRRLFDERDERSDDGDGELLTVSHLTGVTRRSEKPDVGMFMAETLEGYKRCLRGDLVINTMWAWMGAAGTASEAGLVSPSYNVYVPDSQFVLPEFLDMAYRSRRYVVGMTSESRGIWSSRLRLYPQHFLSLVTVVPPMNEQQAIVAYVADIEDRVKRMASAVRDAIERLGEYRMALVSAAVTGKIDVRRSAVDSRGGV